MTQAIKIRITKFIIASLAFLMGATFGVEHGADFYLSGVIGVGLVSYWGVLFYLIYEI